MVVPVAQADESAFGDATDGDSVFDAGAGEERRGSVPILRYSREPNKYGETTWVQTVRMCRTYRSCDHSRRAVMLSVARVRTNVSSARRVTRAQCKQAGRKWNETS